jgi:dihydropteroate synthase
MQTFTWQCGKYLLQKKSPFIMGILNVTPDSFSDGGSYASVSQAVARAHEMLAQGADIIDVGGESTRPGSSEVSMSEELSRVLPVVRALAQDGVCVSVDSRHSPVVASALVEGAAIINDITGFTDANMLALAANSKAGCVIMHMLGEPKTMQENPVYRDVVTEVRAFLVEKAAILEQHGVARERICVDPGPGFGKNFEQNRSLLKATAQFAQISSATDASQAPYLSMAAWSRKRFIGELTGVTEPRQRVVGSVAAAVYAASQGAGVLRVHDVEQTVQALKVIEVLA